MTRYTGYDIPVPVQYTLRGTWHVLVQWSSYCLLVVGLRVIRQAGRPQWAAATTLRLSAIWEANTNTEKNFTGYFANGLTQVHGQGFSNFFWGGGFLFIVWGNFHIPENHSGSKTGTVLWDVTPSSVVQI